MLLAVASAGCGDPTGVAGDQITIGLLLPFTGADSATTSNFERAVLFAAGRVNGAGGVRGRRLHILSKDTHSNLGRALQSTDELVAAGAVAVLGPESADIAAAIGPILARNRVVFFSPLVGAADDTAVDCTQPWFRLVPSARALGQGIAKLVYADGIASTTVLFETGAYNGALAAAANARFVGLGGNVALVAPLDPTAQSYAATARAALASGAASFILAASPRTGALVVNEIGALTANSVRWFLSPLLDTTLLLENVAPYALEGALGIAPRIYDTTPAFPTAFARRWQGDQPLDGAYFYYDALALLALALQSVEATPGGGVDVGLFEAAIGNAAAPPGEAFGWDEIESGLARRAGGNDVYYSGLTGPMLLDACGVRLLGATKTWEVRSGAIVTRD